MILNNVLKIKMELDINQTTIILAPFYQKPSKLSFNSPQPEKKGNTTTSYVLHYPGAQRFKTNLGIGYSEMDGRRACRLGHSLQAARVVPFLKSSLVSGWHSRKPDRLRLQYRSL